MDNNHKFHSFFWLSGEVFFLLSRLSCYDKELLILDNLSFIFYNFYHSWWSNIFLVEFPVHPVFAEVLKHTMDVTMEVTMEVKRLLGAMDGEISRKELQKTLKLKMPIISVKRIFYLQLMQDLWKWPYRVSRRADFRSID